MKPIHHNESPPTPSTEKPAARNEKTALQIYPINRQDHLSVAKVHYFSLKKS